MSAFTIAEIARALQAPAAGDLSLRICGAAEPAEAGPDQLAVAMRPAYGEALAQGRARAAVLWEGADWKALGLEAAVFVARPRLALAALTAHLAGRRAATGGPGGDDARAGRGEIHPGAQIDPGARIGAHVSVGAFSLVGPGAVLGEGVWLGAHVSIGAGVRIGDGARLEDGVRIASGVRIGARFHALPGVVIGADGFSYVTAEKSRMEVLRETLGDEAAGGAERQAWLKIESLGGVEIGDDVHVGANSCIDAGTIRPTRVGDGTRIDNLVQIGHNVTLGRNCLICGQAGVAGSAVLGDNVVLGGQAGVADNISLGDGVIVAAGSMVLSNVPAGRAMMGYPATRMSAQIESYKALRRLPRILRQLAAKKPVPKTPPKR